MPPLTNFLMSGGDMPFVPAEPCVLTGGPHHGNQDQSAFLVADATTKDRSASARFALWRCEECGTLLVGIGATDVPLGGNESAYAQEFTWLEQVPVLIKPDQATLGGRIK
jgi:hypothetical protein